MNCSGSGLTIQALLSDERAHSASFTTAEKAQLTGGFHRSHCSHIHTSVGPAGGSPLLFTHLEFKKMDCSSHDNCFDFNSCDLCLKCMYEANKPALYEWEAVKCGDKNGVD